MKEKFHSNSYKTSHKRSNEGSFLMNFIWGIPRRFHFGLCKFKKMVESPEDFMEKGAESSEELCT